MSRRLPLWLTVGATILAASLPAGIAWGMGQARVEALEARQERMATAAERIDDRLRKIETDVAKALALLERSR